MPLDVEELEPTTRNDYRRANGAPMVLVDGKNQRYSRPSSFAKPLDDESALVNWKIDRACIGVAYDRALQAAFVAVAEGDRDGLSALREKAISAGRGAEKADIGTALHAMSVRWEQKEPGFWPPDPYLSSLVAYDGELSRLGLASIEYEFHTVNRQYRCAGTADRLYEARSPLVTPNGNVLPVGTLLVGDLKTGEKLEYSKAAYAVQLCLYAEGEFYNVLTDEFEDTPPINKDWAIIVHMPADQPGTCELLWVDLEVGRWGAYLVDQIKTWRKMWRSGEFGLPPVEIDANLMTAWDGPCGAGIPTITMPTILDEPPPAESTKPPSVEGDGGSLDDWLEWIKLRLRLIGENDKARARLRIMWPENLPAPKHMTNMAQVDRAIPILNVVEADYGLGFVEQPTALHSTGPRQKGTR